AVNACRAGPLRPGSRARTRTPPRLRVVVAAGPGARARPARLRPAARIRRPAPGLPAARGVPVAPGLPVASARGRTPATPGSAAGRCGPGRDAAERGPQAHL